MSVTYYVDSYDFVIELINRKCDFSGFVFLAQGFCFDYFLSLCEKFHCNSDKVNIETVD